MRENQTLQQSIKLPCGAIIKNRLAKSSMSDSLGDGEGDPTDAQIRLYERWAEGGAGISFIGEVQGDCRYPEKPGNLVLGEQSNVALLQTLTRRAAINGAHIWPQLGHAGALSHLPISNPKGPSALDLDGLQCAGLSDAEVQALPDMYARVAVIAKSVGFTGVHIHAGHGFLLSQFLSPLFNHREDDFGGSIEGRARIVLAIIEAVRVAVGPEFPVGIRINSTDQLEGGLTPDDALAFVAMLDKTSIDLIDISGGTYFPGAKASSEGTSKGAYFIEFARRAREVTSIPLMLTGGFKARNEAADAVSSGAADIIGLGRAMALNPNLANTWLSEEGGDPDFPRFSAPPPGGITAWFTLRLTDIGEGRESDIDYDMASTVAEYESRDEERSERWLKKFSY